MILLIPVIEMIPNAALAAMLIFAGYRLAAPKEFISTYKIGTEQFAIFLVTIIITLAEDLLLGIAAGILLKIIFHMFNGAQFNSLFKAEYKLTEKNGEIHIAVTGSAIFSNLIGFKKLFEKHANASKIVVDFSQCRLIDHSFMEFMHKMQHDIQLTGKSMIAIGMENHKPLSAHPYAARKMKNAS
jgi:MFS superfamily sulfate permease-like transporter